MKIASSCKFLAIFIFCLFCHSQIFNKDVENSFVRWEEQNVEGYYLFVHGLKRSEDEKSPIFVKTNFFDLDLLNITAKKTYQIGVLATNNFLVGEESSRQNWTNQYPAYPTGFKKTATNVFWKPIIGDIKFYNVYYKTIDGQFSKSNVVRVSGVQTNCSLTNFVLPVVLTISAEDSFGNESQAQNQITIRN